VYHHIDKGEARPIRQPSRILAEVGEILNDIQRRGIIEESDSPWSYPVVVLRKTNGEAYFCLEYRKLKDVTKKCCLPLPRTNEGPDTLSGTKWFSTLDLKSGY
jgi:hypothetical protein